MNRLEYDALVHEVASTTPKSFPGVSKTLEKAFRALDELSTRWRQPAAVSPAGGLLLCPRWPRDVRDRLLTHCDMVSWQRLELQPQSPVFNAGLLFGEAGQAGI
jgi:hypothetical protein